MTFAAPSLALMVLPMGLLFAAATDLRRYIIPNTASIALIAGFVLVYALAAMVSPEVGLALLGEHLASEAACFVFGFALFAFGLWGGGDGKLLAAAGLWFDWPTVVEFLLATTVAGGLFSLLVMALWIACDQLRFTPGFERFLTQIDWARRKSDAPFGVAIAAGALVAFPSTALFHALAIAPLL